MIEIILYTTAGCHLCVLAEHILNSQDNVNITLTEIGDNDKLIERYGTSIPVIKFADHSELNWPFTQADLEHKLAETTP